MIHWTASISAIVICSLESKIAEIATCDISILKLISHDVDHITYVARDVYASVSLTRLGDQSQIPCRTLPGMGN